MSVPPATHIEGPRCSWAPSGGSTLGVSDWLSIWGAVLSTFLGAHQIWGALRQRVRVEFTTQTAFDKSYEGELVRRGDAVVVRLINATAQPFRVHHVTLKSDRKDGGWAVININPCEMTQGWMLPVEVSAHDSYSFVIPLRGPTLSSVPFDTGIVWAEITCSLGNTYKSKRMPKEKAPSAVPSNSMVLVNSR